MRAAAIVLCFIYLAASCQAPMGYDWDESALAGLPAVESVSEAWAIAAGVEYDGSLDSKTPAETYRAGRGDCKDISALMVAILRLSGFEAEIIRTGYTIDGDGHRLVYVDGVGYLEPQAVGYYYREDELDIVARYSLEAYLGGAI